MKLIHTLDHLLFIYTFAIDDFEFHCIILVHNAEGTVLIFSRQWSGSITLARADFAGGGCGGDGGDGGYGGFAAEPHSAVDT